MSTIRTYRDLAAWTKSMDWAVAIHRVTRTFPVEERFGLTSQLWRAAMSVPANIAEGAERSGTGEFLQFLSVASGSLAEAETFLILAGRLGYVAAEEQEDLLRKAAEVGKIVSGLRRSLQARRSASRAALTTDH
jgi:four helix bundle protein